MGPATFFLYFFSEKFEKKKSDEMSHSAGPQVSCGGGRDDTAGHASPCSPFFCELFFSKLFFFFEKFEKKKAEPHHSVAGPQVK